MNHVFDLVIAHFTLYFDHILGSFLTDAPLSLPLYILIKELICRLNIVCRRCSHHILLSRVLIALAGGAHSKLIQKLLMLLLILIDKSLFVEGCHRLRKRFYITPEVTFSTNRCL